MKGPGPGDATLSSGKDSHYDPSQTSQEEEEEEEEEVKLGPAVPGPHEPPGGCSFRSSPFNSFFRLLDLPEQCR